MIIFQWNHTNHRSENTDCYKAVPIVGGIDTLDLPGASVLDLGFAEDPGPSHQSSLDKMNLKEEIVVKVVEPEESLEDMAVVPPSQEQLSFLGSSSGSSSGKGKAKTKGRSQTDQNEITEEDLIQMQQTQMQVIQSGFDNVNHNLRLLQQGIQDLSNSLSIMAHTLVAIKNVYVKNNTGPTTYATVSTQTTAGYLSPASPQISPAEDRGRAQEYHILYLCMRLGGPLKSNRSRGELYHQYKRVLQV
ncbi:hypothetical protein Y1Q_0016014 [Alligator mississippiensis]|uniref:Uncharacterized protein n=1 Tax=Alligator mississippiensis TaxID=8496 RepID=A0A151MVC3_ALLMI|nr:hypothetical protein Y1Q_0016014 [Alligator mississippiensis]